MLLALISGNSIGNFNGGILFISSSLLTSSAESIKLSISSNVGIFIVSSASFTSFLTVDASTSCVPCAFGSSALTIIEKFVSVIENTNKIIVVIWVKFFFISHTP